MFGKFTRSQIQITQTSDLDFLLFSDTPFSIEWKIAVRKCKENNLIHIKMWIFVPIISITAEF